MRDASRDVQDLERQLQSTGSSRTADDVQAEIKAIGEKMYVRSLSLASDLLTMFQLCTEGRSRAIVFREDGATRANEIIR